MSKEVVELLTWAKEMLEHSPQFRQDMKKIVMKQLSNYSAKGEGHPDKSAGKKMTQFISKQFEFVGFTPNIMYIKAKGSSEDLKPLWVHPFGTPTLVFSHRELPVLVMTNPGLRYHKNFLDEHGLKKFNLGYKQPHMPNMLTG